MGIPRGAPVGRSRRLIAGVLVGGGLVATGCSDPTSQDAVVRPPIETAVVPTTGLVGEWKLDESGGTVANDTKNNFDANVFGGAAFIGGQLGNALNLNNGTSGTGGKYAQMPANATLDSLQEGNYTISAWFFAYSAPTDATPDNRHWAIVIKSGHHLGLVYQNDQRFAARHYLVGDVLESASSSATYPINTWHHVAGVVSKTAGTVRVYVDGALQGTNTFTANTAAKEYNATPWRIGRGNTNWAANGRVDQVRIYNRALSAGEVADLFNESASTFHFPVGMTKGNQLDLMGDAPVPDGHYSAGNATNLLSTLNAARTAGVRITIRVTLANNLMLKPDSTLDIPKWKSEFDQVKGVDVGPYVADGTLIGHFAIDEPFADFKNMTAGQLEQLCQYQKTATGTKWQSVPCIVRDKNTRLADNSPAGGYDWVDAGWAQLADHTFVPPPPTGYSGNIGAYFRDNLQRGLNVGLGLMYGFNLLNGGVEFAGCAKPDSQDNCAMTATEIRKMADTLAAIGNNQGAGVIGWQIDNDPGPERDYFFGTGIYAGNGIQSALQYLNATVGGLTPGPVNVRGDLPPP